MLTPGLGRPERSTGRETLGRPLVVVNRNRAPGRGAARPLPALAAQSCLLSGDSPWGIS